MYVFCQYFGVDPRAQMCAYVDVRTPLHFIRDTWFYQIFYLILLRHCFLIASIRGIWRLSCSISSICVSRTMVPRWVFHRFLFARGVDIDRPTSFGPKRHTTGESDGQTSVRLRCRWIRSVLFFWHLQRCVVRVLFKCEEDRRPTAAEKKETVQYLRWLRRVMQAAAGTTSRHRS